MRLNEGEGDTCHFQAWPIKLCRTDPAPFPNSTAEDLEEVGGARLKKPGSLNDHIEYCQPKPQSRPYESKKKMPTLQLLELKTFPKSSWTTLADTELF